MALDVDVDSQMEPGDTLTSSCAERTRPCEHSWILRWGRERHRATETTPCRGTILAICERNGSLGSLQNTTHVSHRSSVAQTRLSPGCSVITYKMCDYLQAASSNITPLEQDKIMPL